MAGGRTPGASAQDVPTGEDTALEPQSVVRFHDSLQEGLRVARETDRLVFVVIGRYNPP